MAEYKKGNTPRTVRKTMDIVNSVLKDAECRRLVVGNARWAPAAPQGRDDGPALALRGGRAGARGGGARHGNKFATLVLLAVYTGARAGEIAGLRVSDLNLRARSVRIARTAQHTTCGTSTPRCASPVG